jgi:hypothetical protein
VGQEALRGRQHVGPALGHLGPSFPPPQCAEPGPDVPTLGAGSPAWPDPWQAFGDGWVGAGRRDGINRDPMVLGGR